MREKITDIDFTVNVKTAKIASHENNITELLQRMDYSEKNTEELIKTRIILEKSKCDQSMFDEVTKHMLEQLKRHNNEIFENSNQSSTIENYLEKYQPIRTQIMITDTLNSISQKSERKRLENYDTEKMALLYKVILEDQGVASILRLITKLNERAKKDLEEDDKIKKRRTVMNETSLGLANDTSGGRKTG